MKATVAVVALLVAVAGHAAATDARAPKAPRCSQRGTQTLLATRDARVFRTDERELGEQRVYGCLYRSGRRTRLGFVDCFDQPAVENLALAGRFAAYSLETCNRGSGTAQVVVTDLARRAPVRRVAVPQTYVFQSVSDLVLTRRGSIAWIEWGADLDAKPIRRVAVRKADSMGVATLAEGTDLARGSLALGGDASLYWRRGGAPQRAELR